VLRGGPHRTTNGAWYGCSRVSPYSKLIKCSPKPRVGPSIPTAITPWAWFDTYLACHATVEYVSTITGVCTGCAALCWWVCAGARVVNGSEAQVGDGEAPAPRAVAAGERVHRRVARGGANERCGAITARRNAPAWPSLSYPWESPRPSRAGFMWFRSGGAALVAARRPRSESADALPRSTR
jgi:hypothetical protein